MRARPAARARRGTQGFSLIEVLVALWVLAIALLAGLALVQQQPRAVRRIDAERQAVRGMEWTLESIRAGLIPLASENLTGFTAATDPKAPAADLKVAVAVAPAAGGATDLFQVSLVATYTVYGQRMKRTMQTLVWRPGASP